MSNFYWLRAKSFKNYKYNVIIVRMKAKLSIL